ncbi:MULTISPECIES: IPT/TIG domain-containing protein [unclassified Streptomyces]|uniref:IPT/TIG domain-containing protein n=1 Tax=unclassified Streptomyces TaxID=2593676 RepID=UPI00037E35B9|nr:IPT/TIG domain-containing protein [Streptomyces sp. BoleA5]
MGSPVLTGLSPAQGPTDAGSGVTLSGTGLTTTTAVHFGVASAAFTVLFATGADPGEFDVNAAILHAVRR